MLNKNKAFTLIELSIVLTIVGVLIAGILVGQSLIKTSQIRSLITDLNIYQSAMNIFKLKYSCIAGDCPKASSFLKSPTYTVYNGNGNLIIDPYTTNDEVLYVWQHLSLANMILGNYTGEYISGSQVAGINIPAAKLPNVGFTFDRDSNIYGKDLFGLEIGGAKDSCCSVYNGSALTPADASMLDAKMDDGMPAIGKIIVVRGAMVEGFSVCVDQSKSFSGNLNNVNYLSATDDSVSCRVWYVYNL